MNKVTFNIYPVEDVPFAGAYKVGSFKSGSPSIYFAVDFLAEYVNGEPKEYQLIAFKDAMLQTLTHEFAHAMQEFLDKEYSEEEVEKILGQYNKKWNLFDAEQPMEQPTMPIMDFIEFMRETKAETLAEFKEEVLQMFKPVLSWYEK